MRSSASTSPSWSKHLRQDKQGQPAGVAGISSALICSPAPIGFVRRRLIHDYNKVAVWMIGQHLAKEGDDLIRCYSLLEKAEEKMAGLADGGHGCDSSSCAGYADPRRPATRRPCPAEEGGQRDIRFILKIQDSTVFFDGSPDPGRLGPHPLSPGVLVDFEVRSFRFLAGEARVAKAPPDRILGHSNPMNVVYDGTQPANGPQIGLIAVIGGRLEHKASPICFAQVLQFARATTAGFPQKSCCTFLSVTSHPSKDSGPIRLIRSSYLGNAQTSPHRLHGSHSDFIRGVIRTHTTIIGP